MSESYIIGIILCDRGLKGNSYHDHENLILAYDFRTMCQVTLGTTP